MCPSWAIGRGRTPFHEATVKHLVSLLATLCCVAAPASAQLQGTCTLVSSGNYFVIRVNGDSIGRHDTEVTMAARVLSEHLKRPGSAVTATRVQTVRPGGCLVAPARVDTVFVPVVVPPPPPPVDTLVTPPPPVDTVVTPPPPPPPPVTPPSAGTLPAHPRVWMDASRVAHLKRERAAASPRWTRVLALADAQVARTTQYSSVDLDKVPSLCLAYLATDDARYATRVGFILTNYATAANTLTGDSGYGVRFALPLVTMGLDWCYQGLTVAQRQQAATWLMDRADWVWPESNVNRKNAHGTALPGNYFWGFLMTGPAALAAAGDDTGTGTLSGTDRATFHRDLVLNRWNNSIATFFTGEGVGGAWTEGTKYDSSWRLGSLVDGFQTAGIAMTTPFLEASLQWRLHSTMPGFRYKVPFGDQPGMPAGDMYTYDRLAALYALPSAPAMGPLVYAWLNLIGKVPTTEFNATAMLADELLRFDPAVVPATDFSALPKSYLAAGTGFFVSRSSWTDPNATVIAFESGPTGDHGARDANGLMIWKGGFWISATANIYSHTGIEGATVHYNNLTVGGVGQYLYPGNGGSITGTFASDTLVRVGGQAWKGYGYQTQWVNTRTVTDYRREVAFLPTEDVIVVVDRATVKAPASAKVWRWHSKNAAVISGNTFVLTNPAGDQRCHATVVHPTATLGTQSYAIGTGAGVSSHAVTVTMAGQASDVVVTVFQCNGQPPLVPQVTVASTVTVTVAGRTVTIP